MANNTGALVEEMMKYERGIPHRVNHFLKVYSFAKVIGELEQLDRDMQDTLETAAIVHDIGIRPSVEKYQSDGGNFQEIEGPPIAREMLGRLGYPEEMTERVCWLVGHHHTYGNIEEKDHQILVEADFLVNLYEQKSNKQAILSARKNIFRTAAGIRLINHLFSLPEV